MAEFVIKAASGLFDLSVAPLADLPDLDEAALEVAVERLIQPCADTNNTTAVTGGHVRMWQNYRTEH